MFLLFFTVTRTIPCTCFIPSFCTALRLFFSDLFCFELASFLAPSTCSKSGMSPSVELSSSSSSSSSPPSLLPCSALAGPAAPTAALALALPLALALASTSAFADVACEAVGLAFAFDLAWVLSADLAEAEAETEAAASDAALALPLALPSPAAFGAAARALFRPSSAFLRGAAASGLTALSAGEGAVAAVADCATRGVGAAEAVAFTGASTGGDTTEASLTSVTL
mmetsp:Transcript_25796/g.60011  ORF Transcript_25796/g.60011 Transcript_25796/m.60011 type:complete len:226 (+) Transcript_25796:2-679(+)